jgi:ATP/maltotriose-dependent transcriptional regulator MalT
MYYFSLEKITGLLTDQQLLLLLAKAYSASGQYEKALEALQLCVDVKTSKTDPDVLQEMDRIESILKASNGSEADNEANEFEDYDPEQFEASGTFSFQPDEEY